MTLYDAVEGVRDRAAEERRDLHKERTMKAYFVLRDWQAHGRVAVPGVVVSEGAVKDTEYPNAVDHYLATVCGYAGVDDMADNWREETTAVLAGLVGSNGWAIYKMLLARRGK